MDDLLNSVVKGSLIGFGTTIIGMVGYVTYMCAAEKGHGWIALALIGLALWWVFGDYFPTGPALVVSVMACIAAFFFGAAVEREAAAQAKRDE